MLFEKNPQNRNDGYSVFLGIFFVIIIHIYMMLTNIDAFLNRISITDVDGYWHLLRAERIFERKDIYDMTLERSNAPYGENIHWTSSFDLVLFIGAYIGSFFTEFNNSLYWWSAFVNPILHILTFFVIVLSMKQLLGYDHTAILGCFFAFQQHITMRYCIGVPDHHGILLFFFSVLVCLTIRMIYQGMSLKLGVTFGILGAIAIWNGIETLVVLILSLVTLGLIWIHRGSDIVKHNLAILISLLLATILTMLIDVPLEQLMRVEYDRRSIVHVVFWILITIYWTVVFLFKKYSSAMLVQKKRFAAATIGSVSCIFVMFMLFPSFFYNPTTKIDPLVRSIYIDMVREFQPIFSSAEKFPSHSMVSWAFALVGMPVCILLSWRSSGRKRYAWCYIALISTVYLGLAAFTKRWLIYCQFISTIPLSFLSMAPLSWINSHLKPTAKIITRPILIAIFCSSFWLLPIFFGSPENKSLLQDKQFLKEICKYLNEDQYFKSTHRRILTSIYLGPLIMYMTPHEIVGTPAHRNEEGIIDTYKVMNAKDEEEAHTVLKKRGINALLIGKANEGIFDFFIEKEAKSTAIFHRQLWSGAIPKWLEPLSMPESLADKVKVFKVLS